VQLSPDALVPLEQFGLGGIDSVRGYRQDALLTDNGAFVSAEVRLPIYRSPQRQTVLQLTPFVDAGTTWGSSQRNNLMIQTP
jgi:hemolysin activation/secretion protein